MTLLSNDSERFHSCYSHNNSTVYHDTSQFGMASAIALGDSIADPFMQPLVNAPARNIKNVFVFSLLTNVVKNFASIGDLHICRTNIFEVVKLKQDNQKCVQFNFSKKMVPYGSASNLTETKICVGKVFLELSDSEVLLALTLKKPPTLKKEMPTQQSVPRSDTNSNKQKTCLKFDGLEFDFKFGSTGL